MFNHQLNQFDTSLHRKNQYDHQQLQTQQQYLEGTTVPKAAQQTEAEILDSDGHLLPRNNHDSHDFKKLNHAEEKYDQTVTTVEKDIKIFDNGDEDNNVNIDANVHIEIPVVEVVDNSSSNNCFNNGSQIRHDHDQHHLSNNLITSTEEVSNFNDPSSASNGKTTIQQQLLHQPQHHNMNINFVPIENHHLGHDGHSSGPLVDNGTPSSAFNADTPNNIVYNNTNDDCFVEVGDRDPSPPPQQEDKLEFQHQQPLQLRQEQVQIQQQPNYEQHSDDVQWTSEQLQSATSQFDHQEQEIIVTHENNLEAAMNEHSLETHNFNTHAQNNVVNENVNVIDSHNIVISHSDDIIYEQRQLEQSHLDQHQQNNTHNHQQGLQQLQHEQQQQSIILDHHQQMQQVHQQESHQQQQQLYHHHSNQNNETNFGANNTVSMIDVVNVPVVLKSVEANAPAQQINPLVNVPSHNENISIVSNEIVVLTPMEANVADVAKPDTSITNNTTIDLHATSANIMSNSPANEPNLVNNTNSGTDMNQFTLTKEEVENVLASAAPPIYNCEAESTNLDENTVVTSTTVPESQIVIAASSTVSGKVLVPKQQLQQEQQERQHLQQQVQQLEKQVQQQQHLQQQVQQLEQQVQQQHLQQQQQQQFQQQVQQQQTQQYTNDVSNNIAKMMSVQVPVAQQAITQQVAQQAITQQVAQQASIPITQAGPMTQVISVPQNVPIAQATTVANPIAGLPRTTTGVLQQQSATVITQAVQPQSQSQQHVQQSSSGIIDPKQQQHSNTQIQQISHNTSQTAPTQDNQLLNFTSAPTSGTTLPPPVIPVVQNPHFHQIPGTAGTATNTSAVIGSSTTSQQFVNNSQLNLNSTTTDGTSTTRSLNNPYLQQLHSTQVPNNTNELIVEHGRPPMMGSNETHNHSHTITTTSIYKGQHPEVAGDQAVIGNSGTNQTIQQFQQQHPYATTIIHHHHHHHVSTTPAAPTPIATKSNNKVTSKKSTTSKLLNSSHSLSLQYSQTKKKDFEYRFKELLEYKEEHGDLMIPHKFPKNPSLGTWVDTQRRRYRKFIATQKEQKDLESQQNIDQNTGEYGCEGSKGMQGRGNTAISKDQVHRLLEIGFVFEPRLSRQETWNRRFEELTKYKERHGHCNVREDDTNNPGLGKWVSYIRRSHRLSKQGRRAKGKRLSDDRMRQLKAIGFVFELKEEMATKRYRDGVELLKEFLRKEGHCGVPTFFPSNPTLGLCVEEMRKEYRKFAFGQECALDKDVLDELTEIGFLSEEHLSVPIHNEDGTGESGVNTQQIIQVQQPLEQTKQNILHHQRDAQQDFQQQQTQVGYSNSA